MEEPSGTSQPHRFSKQLRGCTGAACGGGAGRGEAGTRTHSVRIFGMWLKLVTRIRLMLLLLRVLRRAGKTETVSGEAARDAYGRGGAQMGLPAQGPSVEQRRQVGGPADDGRTPDSCCQVDPSLPSQYLATYLEP